MAHLQRDANKVAMELGQQIGMEEHFGDHSNNDNINISIPSTNFNHHVPQMFKAIFSNFGPYSSSCAFACIKEEIWTCLKKWQHLSTFEHVEQVDQEILKGHNITLARKPLLLMIMANVVDEAAKAIVVEISKIQKEYDLHEIALRLVEHYIEKMLEDFDTIMEQRPIQMGPTSASVELAKRNLANFQHMEKRLLFTFKMEFSRCQVVYQGAHYLLLIMDSIQATKAELASMELMSYKLQCTSCLMEVLECIEHILFEKRHKIVASEGQCNLVLRELYRYVDEAKQIVEECCRYKSWILIAIFFMDNGHAFHQITLNIIEFTKILLRALSQVNQNEKPSMEIGEGEITIDCKHFNVGATKFKKPFVKMSSLEQNAHEDRIELIKQLVWYVQEQELHEDDLIWVPILVAKFLGPYVYYDIHIDRIIHLGTGECGHVYKIMWIGLECAQKVFKDVHNKSTFKKEASSWVALCHQNIVHIFGGIIVGGECSLVMELMSTNLHKFMESRNSFKQNAHPCSLHVAIDIILQIAQGMLYLHDKKIVHLDLRPQNILVTPVSNPYLAKEGYVHVKLADFGLCEFIFPHHLSCSHKGATNYTAPELVEENVKVGSTWKAPNLLGKCFIENLDHPMKIDVFSFGMVCYEILIGLVHYDHVCSQDLRKIICEKGKRPSLPKFCSSTLVSLIEKCCAKNPSDRPNFASIVEHLEHLKQLILLPRSLSYGSPSHPQINKRARTTNKVPSLELSQNPSDNLIITNFKSPNFSYERSKSLKRSHDYLMEEDEYHEFVGEEQIDFVDKMPYPTFKLTKFPRSNSNIETPKFNRFLHGNKYEHVINPTNWQGSPGTNLSRELSSSHSQSRGKYIGCSQMEVNVKDMEGENEIVIWNSPHKVDITMVKNDMDANHQDIRLCNSSHKVDITMVDDDKDTNNREIMALDNVSPSTLMTCTNLEEENSKHGAYGLNAPLPAMNNGTWKLDKDTLSRILKSETLRCFLHPPKLPNPDDEVIDCENKNQLMEGGDLVSLHSTQMLDHHNEEQIVTSSIIYETEIESFYTNFTDTALQDVDSEEYDVIDFEYMEDEKTWDTNWKMGMIIDEKECYPWDTSLEVCLEPLLDIKKDPGWNFLPKDIHEASFNKLDYEDLCQMKLTSKEVKAFIDSDAYHTSRGEARPNEASMSSLYFFIKHGSWQCSGFDCISGKWRRLPPLTCLPPPDEDLFKEYLVAGSDGLFCINVSKVPHEERLIVCNPLTQKKIELPPLKLRRNPVLMHMLVNPATNSYKVIVAGSSGMEGGGLSKCTEVFDSLTSEWTRTGDIPGPEFCLNEYQTGVCINNILYCIAFLDDGSGKAISGKGVLAYDVNEGKWMANWRCPLPSPTCHHTNSIAQLLECNGELHLFLEREHGRHVDHCIEKLESQFSSVNMVGNWKNVVKESKTGGRGLLVYPEFTCVPHGDGKVCIFNTIEHKGVVYDIVHGGNVEEIQPPPTHLGEGFHSLNPLSFTFHPNFKIKVDGNVNKLDFINRPRKFSTVEASFEKVDTLDKSSKICDQKFEESDVLAVQQLSLCGRPSIDDPNNKVDANQERNGANSFQLFVKHKKKNERTYLTRDGVDCLARRPR